MFLAILFVFVTRYTQIQHYVYLATISQQNKTLILSNNKIFLYCPIEKRNYIGKLFLHLDFFNTNNKIRFSSIKS